jgi:peptide/nickel transport system substrate-binding protein
MLFQREGEGEMLRAWLTKTKMRDVPLLTVALVVLVANGGPGRAEAAAAPGKPAGVLNVGSSYIGNEALDPRLSVTSGCKLTLLPLYDHLVGANYENNSDISKETGLARDWDISADGIFYTFYIRKGVKFHNGDEVTAHDAKYSLERLALPGTKASYASGVLQGIKSLDAVDDYTLRVTLNKASFTFIYDVSQVIGCEGMVVPKKYIDKVGEEKFARNPIGSGPYKFKEHSEGSYLRYEAVDNHWLIGVPTFKEVYYRYVTEEGTRIGMLQTGEADVIDVSRDRVEEIKRAGAAINTKPRFSFLVMYFHGMAEKGAPLSDIRVRRAISLAVNREEMAERLLHGYGRPTSCHTADLVFKPEKCQPFSFDPAEAKRLLVEAGYPNGFKIQLASFPRLGFPEQFIVGQSIASYLKDVGIEVSIQTMDWGVYYDKWFKKEWKNTIAPLAIVQQPLTHTILQVLFDSKSPLALTKSLDDTEMDRLIDELLASKDLKEYAERYYKVNDRANQQYYWVTFFDGDATWAYNPKKLDKWVMGTSMGDIGSRILVKR